MVSVPLDWDHPNGKKIELAVIRRLASRPQQRIGSMFVNPGGPGESGYELVQTSGADFDAWGGGRFDVVGWDPAGHEPQLTGGVLHQHRPPRTGSGPGVTIPITAGRVAGLPRKTVELARRCGEVSGDLLSHISTTDTARDLDALRRLVGDRLLTYVGLSYGSMIGQTYANLFPGRVRAMMLDGIVDAVDYTTSAEARTANDVSSADEVFDAVHRAVPERRPRPLRARRSRRARRPTGGGAVRPGAPGADPGAQRQPARRRSATGTCCYSTFTPLRLPLTWPAVRGGPRGRRQR